jgi:hypothetical protein
MILEILLPMSSTIITPNAWPQAPLLFAGLSSISIPTPSQALGTFLVFVV